MGGKGRVVDISAMIAGVLAMDGFCNFIFYNVMFGSRIGGVFEAAFLEQVGVVDFGDFEIHIDTVEEGSGELFGVILDLGLGAGTFVCGVT